MARLPLIEGVPAKMVSKRSRVEEDGYSTSGNTKRRIELPADLFCPIMEWLPLIDVFKAKVVSHAWNSSARFVLSSNSHTRFLKSPWLLLPPKQHGEGGYSSYSDCVGGNSFRIMNLEENVVYDLKKTTSALLSEATCIGSSHGWLILSDHTTFTPFLFNPFTEARIQFPSLKPEFGVSEIEEDDRGRCKILCEGEDEWVFVRKGELHQSYISRAFLTAEPGGDFAVVLLCYFYTEQLLYCKNGDSEWTVFYDSGFPNRVDCFEIICNGNKIHVLTACGEIRTWDLESLSPERGTKILFSLPRGTLERPNLNHLRDYLVQSDGEILLVARFLPEDYNITEEIFDVYKLDLEGKKWVEVETLGDDRSLFLGENQSVSVSTKDLSTCRGNSIYFTHDTRIFGLYDPCEMGIYSLNDGKISPIFEFPSKALSAFSPVPHWVIPNSC